jgi:hypothetical protein
VPSIEVVPPFKVVLTPVEVQTFDVTVSAPNPVVQVVSEGPQGPGVPRGGVEFDLLEKAGPDDFDTRFTSAPTVVPHQRHHGGHRAGEPDLRSEWSGAGCDYKGHGGFVCGRER